MRADVEADIAYHLDSGLPGDATSVRLLYLALNWLIGEHLTLPRVFSDDDVQELVAIAVQRAVPREQR